jgi:hypothetical protein
MGIFSKESSSSKKRQEKAKLRLDKFQFLKINYVFPHNLSPVA